MSRGGYSRPQSSWNRSCRSRVNPSLIPRHQQLRFQLDSDREHPPCDMSSSETGRFFFLWRRVQTCPYFGGNFLALPGLRAFAEHVERKHRFVHHRFVLHTSISP
eukprot:gene27218-biopygen7482